MQLLVRAIMSRLAVRGQNSVCKDTAGCEAAACLLCFLSFSAFYRLPITRDHQPEGRPLLQSTQLYHRSLSFEHCVPRCIRRAE